jgi:mannose-1-phosphate guanylyltransferase
MQRLRGCDKTRPVTAYVLIMAGGGGTRLWPASRKRRPKQFLPLLPGAQTLLGATVERVLPLAPIERVLVVTAASQVADVESAVPPLPRANIVVEPEARNTAPCIGLGVLEVLRRDPDAVVAVLPSDQHVADADGFRRALATAVDVAARGPVVTVGIRPTGPEVGFGYLECGEEKDEARVVDRFVEKPDREKAERYLAQGNYLWNAGMFIFRAARIREDFRRCLPELGRILDELAADPGRTATLYPTAPSISFDYGVMERLPAGEVRVVAGDFGWSDVGAWSALGSLIAPDDHGNVASGAHVTVDARDNILYGDGKHLIAAVGVSGLVIVATDDAVLVLPRERAQDVREVVRALETNEGKTYL